LHTLKENMNVSEEENCCAREFILLMGITPLLADFETSEKKNIKLYQNRSYRLRLEFLSD